jgi:hypothetical protein
LASPISEGEQIWDLTIGPNSGQKILGGKFFGKGVLKFLKGFLGLKEIWYLIALLVFDKGSGI